MTYLAKPRMHHPSLAPNEVGYTRRDYEGKVSTLCAGCGHDSISAAIIQACYELNIEPHRVCVRLWRTFPSPLKRGGVLSSSVFIQQHPSVFPERHAAAC